MIQFLLRVTKIDNNTAAMRRWAHSTNIMHRVPIKVVRKAAGAAFCSGLLIFTACLLARGQYRRTNHGKFDAFGDLNTDDVMAHLDRFALELNSNFKLQGFVVIHTRAGSPVGWQLRQAYGHLNYLVNSRGVPASRVKVLENFAKLRMIYPMTLNDVEVRLDREEQLLDLAIYFRERPGRPAKTH